MNVEQSVARLPDAMKRLIASDPAVQALLERGKDLAEALSDPEWATTWLDGCLDVAQLSVLRSVLYKYGANPFEIERIAADAEEEFGLTGAEARVAVAKLRRSGVVFAVRKSWGDRLFYIPVDAVALWQPLLLPANNRALTSEEAWEVAQNGGGYRPPLSLALLSAWHRVAKQPVLRTAKGAPQQAATARVAAALQLEQAAMEQLLAAYPHVAQLPSQAAFAFDVGLVCGVLTETNGAIRICEEGLDEWLLLPLHEAERRLQTLVMTRYCASRPALHLTFSATLALEADRWSTVDRVGEGQGEAEERLALLEALGCIERGTWRGQTAIRRRAEPGSLPGAAEGYFILQPDGEVLVPPDVGMRARWKLSDIAELEKADELYVYRLTQRSCEDACRLGYSLAKALLALEEGSGAPVPQPVRDALRDWFASLGRTELVEALVLRADSKAVADAIAADEGLAGLIVERIGERHFLVDAGEGKQIRAKLRAAGYPAVDVVRTERGAPGEARHGGEQAAGGNKGWLSGGTALSAFEADKGLPGADELFPGLADIPAAWITRPRKYHPSTSKELIRRAIDWQTTVRLERDGGARIFAPRTMRESGALWVAEGRWRPADGSVPSGGRTEPAAVRSEEIAELMIVLPDLEELETD